jgi:hypothetical protein
MMFKEIIAAYFQNHMKSINELREKNAEIF